MSAFAMAIVGGGGISRAHILAAKEAHPAISIASVIDPNPAARASAADLAGATPFASFDEFLASAAAKSVRGVIVCTPPSARIPIIEAALKARMSVLAEKPLAHTLADAQKLRDIADCHSQQVSAVGYCHRFAPAIAEIKRRAGAGEIGEIVRFENTFAAPLIKIKEKWMSDPSISGGGAFMDMGCHSVDLFLHLLGPGAATSAVFHHAWPGRSETAASVMLRSREGAAGVIQSGWCEPARFTVGLVGTRGAFFYDYDHPAELRVRSNDGAEATIKVESHEQRFARQLEAFATQAQGASPKIKPATFADGVAVAEIIDTAQQLATAAPAPP